MPSRKSTNLAERLNSSGYFTPTEPVKQPNVETPEQPTIKRIKRTYYVREETDRILKRVQMARYEETGREPELSDLVDEAIRKLAP